MRDKASELNFSSIPLWITLCVPACDFFWLLFAWFCVVCFLLGDVHAVFHGAFYFHSAFGLACSPN